MDFRVIDTVMVVLFAAAGVWFFGRFVMQCRKALTQLSIAPSVTITPTEEDANDTYTSLDEQQAIEGFVALLERENFRRLDTIKVTNTWLTTTMNSITPLYVSADQYTTAGLGRAQGIFPATLTFTSGFADGASLTTATPYSAKQDAAHLTMQFAFDADTALKAHLSRSQELEKQHGHILPITSVATYEQSRQAALRHFDPSWNERLRQSIVFNQWMYIATILVLFVIAGLLLLRPTGTNAVFMAIALIVVFFVTITITNQLANRNLRLKDALDAGNVPAPDIRYPPVFEWNRQKMQKVKEAS